jgi:hypothetical protein
MPAGIVPTTSSQPRRASASSAAISRVRSERRSPDAIRRQSSKKIPSSTSAVAKCVATRNVRKKSSFWWMSQPSSRGRMTAWPRLETGNGSATPCMTPRTMAWKYEIGCTAAKLRRFHETAVKARTFV